MATQLSLSICRTLRTVSKRKCQLGLDKLSLCQLLRKLHMVNGLKVFWTRENFCLLLRSHGHQGQSSHVETADERQSHHWARYQKGSSLSRLSAYSKPLSWTPHQEERADSLDFQHCSHPQSSCGMCNSWHRSQSTRTLSENSSLLILYLKFSLRSSHLTPLFLRECRRSPYLSRMCDTQRDTPTQPSGSISTPSDNTFIPSSWSTNGWNILVA